MQNKNIDSIVELYHLVGQPLYIGEFDNDIINTLYNYLLSNRKDHYSANQRIAIVQECDDVYDLFGNNLGHTVGHLQKFLTELDITNCFVHIITGNQNIADELVQAKELFSNDQTNIEYSIIDLPFEKRIIKRESFCLRAWKHLYVDTRANLRLCCEADPIDVLGNVRESNVLDVINSDKFNEARLKMLANETVPGCRLCYDKEDIGQISQRQEYNTNWKHEIENALKNTNADGSVNDWVPVTTHVALNNTCNLKCRTCSGLSSSILAQEEKKLLNYTFNYDNQLKNKEKENVLSNIIQTLQSTQRITFAGGEPLLQDEHYAILNHLLSNNLTDIRLNYNINGTTLSHKQHDVCELWNKFSNVRVRFSIDGMDDVFNYIRHGADWKQVKNNFLTVKTRCPQVELGINSCVSFLSIESLLELQQTWHNDGILDIGKHHLDYMLENNDFYSLQTLPLHHKTRIARKIDKHCQWLNQQKSSLEADWQDMKDYMLAEDKQYVLNSLYADLSLRDQYRKENFFKVYPQFVDIFNNL